MDRSPTSRRHPCSPTHPDPGLLEKQEGGWTPSIPSECSWLLAMGGEKVPTSLAPSSTRALPACQSSCHTVLLMGSLFSLRSGHLPCHLNFQELISLFQTYISGAHFILANIYCLQHYLLCCFLSSVKIASDNKVSRNRLPWLKQRVVPLVPIWVSCLFLYNGRQKAAPSQEPLPSPSLQGLGAASVWFRERGWTFPQPTTLTSSALEEKESFH